MYSCCCRFKRYGSKNTPIGQLDAEKIAEATLLYVFTMAFPTLPFIQFFYVLPSTFLMAGKQWFSEFLGINISWLFNMLLVFSSPSTTWKPWFHNVSYWLVIESGLVSSSTQIFACCPMGAVSKTWCGPRQSGQTRCQQNTEITQTTALYRCPVYTSRWGSLLELGLSSRMCEVYQNTIFTVRT